MYAGDGIAPAKRSDYNRIARRWQIPPEKGNVNMKKFLKNLLIWVLIVGGLVAVSRWPRKTVTGTEEIYEGTVIDSAMSVVEEKDCKFICTCESRSYIGIVLKDGSGVMFWESDRCEEKVPAFRDDVVRIETAIEEATGFRVATKITVLEKVSHWHNDPRYQ